MTDVNKPPTEQIFYLHPYPIAVTSSRVTLGDKSYKTANITDVTLEQIARKNGYAVGLIFLGFISVLMSLVSLILLLLGYALIAAGFAWYANIKQYYIVRLHTASGKIDSVTSDNKAFISNIVIAIHMALAYRR